ncbi:MAG: PEP/pyruvate-binding domain-containing protein [Phycisphaerae bacterium]
MSIPWQLDLRDAADIKIVGGKALNLGLLLRADMPAPGGFVVTTATYRAAKAQGGMPAEARASILEAYARMGRPQVAVRSSATAEDLAEASMAGQYGTHLRIEGDDALLHAIGLCWASIDRVGTLAYLREHGLDPDTVAMAVVVQLMVPSDVAGVAFSTDPGTGAAPGVVIEASWGLGEAVVSGHVQPDTFRLDANSGLILDAHIGNKAHWYPPRGVSGQQPVPEARRALPCVNHAQLREIWALCHKVAAHFGRPQDIEWGIAGDKIYLLQSRPITTLEHAEESITALDDVRAQLTADLDRQRGPWVLHNLGETVPRPTPLTWSVLQRFMSGVGGFGELYRMVGYQPSAKVQTAGFLDLIGGRIYMDCSRASEMFADDYPFAYDVEKLRHDPQAAQDPPTVSVGNTGQRMQAARQSTAVYHKLTELAQDLDRKLRQEEFPQFATWCAQEKQRPLTALSGAELVALWETRESKVMDAFAPRSLLPSFVAGWALAELKSFLTEHCWNDEIEVLATELSAGGPPDLTFQANAGLYALSNRKITLDAWLNQYGHRGPGEFDLAAPRWREMPDAVTTLAKQLTSGPDPVTRHEEFGRRAQEHLARIDRDLTPGLRATLRQKLSAVHRYMAFREDGKYFLMLGYDLLRDLALESGRRLGLGEGVFYLTRDELFAALRMGFAPDAPVVTRQRIAKANTRLELPRVIARDSLATLGQAELPLNADRMPAFALSRGTATGPARILMSPTQAGDLEPGYVLVAPSTDPAWTPLFINAAALVLECGGSLSHGAVVAREMGLPAVVLPGATKLLKEGEAIIVDGEGGAVLRGNATPVVTASQNENDTHIPSVALPPPPGPVERLGAKWRNVCLVLWLLYLGGAFLLPAPWVYDPSLRVLDAMFWPLLVAVGKPAAVAILAGALALTTMVMQALLTDNRRLLVAKQRSQLLQKDAAQLPEASPRRAVLLAAAGPVSGRLLAGALLPIALLLGPMVMIFAWLPERVDPSAANAPAGSTVVVSALVSGEHTAPVTLALAPASPLRLGSEATITPPPIRATLEKLRTKWSQPSDLAGQPWEVRAAAERTRTELLADLDTFLKAPIPAREIAWPILSDDKANGSYKVTVTAQGSAPHSMDIVLGDLNPPAPRTLECGPDGPIQSLKITYPKPKTTQVFWKLPGIDWNLGWLWVYLLAYLPIMLIARWLLRIA